MNKNIIRDTIQILTSDSVNDNTTKLEQLNAIDDLLINKDVNKLTAKLSELLKLKWKSEVIDEITKVLKYYQLNPSESYPPASDNTVGSEEKTESATDSSHPQANSTSETTETDKSAEKISLTQEEKDEIINSIYQCVSDEIKPLHDTIKSQVTQLDLLVNQVQTIENLKPNFTSLDATLVSARDTINTETPKIEKAFNDLSKELTASINEKLALLNENKLLKKASEFNNLLQDEFEEIQKELRKVHQKTALAVTQEVIESASIEAKKANAEYVKQAMSTNRNILIYGLLGSCFFSCFVAWFTGKQAGASAGNEVVNYIAQHPTQIINNHTQDTSLKKPRK